MHGLMQKSRLKGPRVRSAAAEDGGAEDGDAPIFRKVTIKDENGRAPKGRFMSRSASRAYLAMGDKPLVAAPSAALSV